MNIESRFLRSSFLLGLVVTLFLSTALARGDIVSNDTLTAQIDYYFVAHLGQTDASGRVLVWEASVTGDLTGQMKWWFGPPPVQNSPFSYYSGRWEFWQDGELVLAGESAGKTVFPGGLAPGAPDGIWDGHGVVTEALGKYNPLKGRKIYESGPVAIGDGPPVTFNGTGMFMIY